MNGFAKGIMAGLMVGAAMAVTGDRMVMKRGRNSKIIRKTAGKALHAMGSFVENSSK